MEPPEAPNRGQPEGEALNQGEKLHIAINKTKSKIGAKRGKTVMQDRIALLERFLEILLSSETKLNT